MLIAVALPVCVKEDKLLAMTMDCLSRLRSQHDLHVFMSVNRHRLPLNELRQAFTSRLNKGVGLTMSAGDRSVAASWNWAFEGGLRAEADRLLILANDVQLQEDSIDALADARFPMTDTGPVVAWSGVATNLHPQANLSALSHGCDFSCCMWTTEGWRRFGLFDENYRPAYFEDNDAVARIVLGGGDVQQLGACRYVHLGSQTLRHDAEMEHHRNHWWGKCQRYFAKKWGGAVTNSPEEMRFRYYKHPYNDSSRALSYWEPEMIHRC